MHGDKFKIVAIVNILDKCSRYPLANYYCAMCNCTCFQFRKRLSTANMLRILKGDEMYFTHVQEW